MTLPAEGPTVFSDNNTMVLSFGPVFYTGVVGAGFGLIPYDGAKGLV